VPLPENAIALVLSALVKVTPWNIPVMFALTNGTVVVNPSGQLTSSVWLLAGDSLPTFSNVETGVRHMTRAVLVLEALRATLIAVGRSPQGSVTEQTVPPPELDTYVTMSPAYEGVVNWTAATVARTMQSFTIAKIFVVMESSSSVDAPRKNAGHCRPAVLIVA
jgi:hypothetical protein